MEIEELRAKAKELGIKNYYNKKPETLTKEIEAIESGEPSPEQVKAPKAPKVSINITKADEAFFKSIGLQVEWLASLANRYDFSRFEYIHKFRAFRCYREDDHVEWIDVNELALSNNKQEITQILQKYQPLQKDKQIIKMLWRR